MERNKLVARHDGIPLLERWMKQHPNDDASQPQWAVLNWKGNHDKFTGTDSGATTMI